MHDGVTPAARDQPSIHWNGDHESDGEAKEQAPPEETVRQPGCDSTRHDEDERIVDQFHRRDRDRVGGDGETSRSTEGNAARRIGPRVSKYPKKKARTTEMVIDAALPQPNAVAITIPNTSPIAHPVRQCSVARTAERFSESWP